MPTRTTKGWLTAEALKSGLKEQAAWQDKYGHHLVELAGQGGIGISPMYRVTHVVWIDDAALKRGSGAGHTKLRYRSFSLTDARTRFTREAGAHA